jgi:1-acyl-sn-glycerol-3-phosphate acyltransferase
MFLMDAYQLPWYRTISRWFIVHVTRLIVHMISQIRIEGLENLPKNGAYLLVFNHVSIYDPPIIVSHLPRWPEMLGAVDVWDRPGQSILARLYGGIPIHRGVVDRTAMSRMLSAVRAGLPLLVAPEGTRSHQPGMQQAKTGIVYILEQTKIPVVPIGITGTTDDYIHLVFSGKRPHVNISIGTAFTLAEIHNDELTPAEIRQQKVDGVMRKIAELVPDEYRGVYAL